VAQGYFKVHRQLFDNPIWTEEPFTRGQAWIDLLGKANHKDNWMFVRGIKVDILRGETCRAEDSLAKDWKWSRGKVRRFLKLLETESMIERKQDNRIGIISICNYSAYQDTEKVNGTTNSTIESRQKADKQYPNKNVNNVKKKRIHSYSNEFEEVFNIYPKRNGLKQGKKPAADLFEKLPLEDKRVCYRGVVNYSSFLKTTDQAAMDIERFIKKRFFEDYQEKVTSQKQQSPTMTAIPGSVYV
jgi:hypothetical protein